MSSNLTNLGPVSPLLVNVTHIHPGSSLGRLDLYRLRIVHQGSIYVAELFLAHRAKGKPTCDRQCRAPVPQRSVSLCIIWARYRRNLATVDR